MELVIEVRGGGSSEEEEFALNFARGAQEPGTRNSWHRLDWSSLPSPRARRNTYVIPNARLRNRLGVAFIVRSSERFLAGLWSLRLFDRRDEIVKTSPAYTRVCQSDKVSK